MRVDLHVHTYLHRFAVATDDILCMDRNGVDVVAITYHNAIDGAREVAALAPARVIIGEEVRTSQGEIIGLFLRDWIAPGQSPRDTVAAIHAQGGLVYVPHPLDRVRGSTLKRDALLSIIPWIDVLEVYNARVLWPRPNRKAREIAGASFGDGAGSDAPARGYRARNRRDGTFPRCFEFMDAIRGHCQRPAHGLCGQHSRVRARFAGA